MKPLTDEGGKMEATLSIKGNKRDGYVLTVSLPSEWVAQFTARMHAVIWHERLYRSWGVRSEDGTRDVTEQHYDTLADALSRMEDVKGHILAAKEALADLEYVDRSYIVRL